MEKEVGVMFVGGVIFMWDLGFDVVVERKGWLGIFNFKIFFFVEVFVLMDRY